MNHWDEPQIEPLPVMFIQFAVTWVNTPDIIAHIEQPTPKQIIDTMFNDWFEWIYEYRRLQNRYHDLESRLLPPSNS